MTAAPDPRLQAAHIDAARARREDAWTAFIAYAGCPPEDLALRQRLLIEAEEAASRWMALVATAMADGGWEPGDGDGEADR